MADFREWLGGAGLRFPVIKRQFLLAFDSVFPLSSKDRSSCMPIITVPKALRDKLGEEGSDALVDLLNQSQDRQKEDILEFVEEKFERRLTEEIGKVNERLTDEIGKVNQRITSETAKLDKRITTEIAKVRTDLIKWMFIFWIGQIGAILGILFAFFK